MEDLFANEEGLPISQYFKPSEFDSPDEYESGLKMDIDFIQMLDVARDLAGVPFLITSGYRTKKHNDMVGGKSNSSHLRGHAADIHCKSGSQRMAIVSALMEAGFNRIGIAKTFVHVDNDPSLPQQVIWTY